MLAENMTLQKVTQQILKETSLKSETENAVNKITNSMDLSNSTLDTDEEKISGLKHNLEENVCNKAWGDQSMETIGEWARETWHSKI